MHGTGGRTIKKPKQQQKPERTCADCIHERACQAWTLGMIHHMNTNGCAIYETVKDSASYLIGYMDGKAGKEIKNADKAGK